MNLITNASDALEGRNGKIELSVKLMEVTKDLLTKAVVSEPTMEGEHVCLQVTDSGCGMDQATLDRIFDPFFTTKFTGRGLGLAAVLGIVRSHKAAIVVDSVSGKGTTFLILFPKDHEHLEDFKRRQAAEEVFQGNGSVLVIDDEDTTRSVACEMLEHFGFSTISATGGREGIALFEKQHSNLFFVLLDMTMPDIDGAETAAQLRGIDSSVPLVIMSGYSETEARSIFSGDHLAGFLQKPFTPQSLARLARTIGSK